MHRLVIPVLFVLFAGIGIAGAATPIPSPPSVDARAYTVIDYHTGRSLAAHDENARLEPASLTKLMTTYIVFQKLAAGTLKLDEKVVVSEHAWRSEGSRTFIQVGTPVPVEFLILGMIVQSGNDATIALAERIGGTEETFTQLMNSEAKRLGMSTPHFVNISGLPAPEHYTTAHDLSLLASALIHDYPQYYKWFSVHEFEYNGIKQQNRNGLLEKDPTVDGLKTGHTDAAGFCLVTSAVRDGMRLVSVVMGSSSMKAREAASAALLNYGYTFFETRLAVKAGTALATAPVWKAEDPKVSLGIDQDYWVTLPRGEAGSLKTAVELKPKLIAPLARSATVGELKVTAGSETLATLPLHPLKPVAGGGLWRRCVDTVRLWFS